MNELNPFLVGFTACLMVSFLLAELFNAIRYPRVLGYISAGILFGLGPIRGLFITEEFQVLLEFLAEIGVVFFLLLAGLELDLGRLKKMSLSALAVGVLSFAVPFMMGVAALGALGFGMIETFVISLCLSVTAAAIAVEILMEYDLLKTDDGAIVVGASMIDDLLGVFALTVLLALVEVGDGPLTTSALIIFSRLYLEYLAFFILAYLIGFEIFPRIAQFVWKDKSKTGMFTLSLVFGLVITILSQVFQLSSLIGAFIAGLIINLTIGKKPVGKEIVDDLTSVTFGMVIPFFFISIGLRFDISSIVGDLPMLLLLLFIGAVGKYLGVLVAGKITGLSNSSIHTIGLGMNDRGGIELIIAMVAFSQGLIGPEIFSIIVAIAFITTFISLYFFKIQIRKNLKAIGKLLDGELCAGSTRHGSLSELAR